MSALHQINLRYDPEQDRLLLRISTKDQAEFRMWLTRRFVKLLWAALLKMAESEKMITSQADPETRKALLGFQHEQALAQADFARTFQETPREAPLGESPLLLSRIEVRAQADGAQVLCLYPPQGQGVNLALDGNLLHSFCKLLQEAVAKTDWDMILKLPAAVLSVDQAEGKLN